MSPTANRQTRRHLGSESTKRGGFSSAAFGVETLSYNFEVDPGRPAYKGPERGYVEVPEPTGGQITEFMNAINAVTQEARGSTEDSGATVDGKEVAAQFASSDPSRLEKFSDRLAEAVTAVTSGNPSKEEMDALPWRCQLAVFKYVSTELLNPKSGSGDTTN